jgi:hypothetical protein
MGEGGRGVDGYAYSRAIDTESKIEDMESDSHG